MVAINAMTTETPTTRTGQPPRQCRGCAELRSHSDEILRVCPGAPFTDERRPACYTPARHYDQGATTETRETASGGPAGGRIGAACGFTQTHGDPRDMTGPDTADPAADLNPSAAGAPSRERGAETKGPGPAVSSCRPARGARLRAQTARLAAVARRVVAVASHRRELYARADEATGGKPDAREATGGKDPTATATGGKTAKSAYTSGQLDIVNRKSSMEPSWSQSRNGARMISPG